MAKRRKRMARSSIICDWCGVFKMVAHAGAKTCSGRCRQRMSFYVSRCGYKPDHISGPITGQDAVDLEIERLLRIERERRAKLAHFDKWAGPGAVQQEKQRDASKAV